MKRLLFAYGKRIFGMVFVLILFSLICSAFLMFFTNVLLQLSFSFYVIWRVVYIVYLIAYLLFEAIRFVSSIPYFYSISQHVGISFDEVVHAAQLKLHKQRPVKEWDAEWVRTSIAIDAVAESVSTKIVEKLKL